MRKGIGLCPIVLTILVITAVMVGCQPQAETPPVPSPTSTPMGIKGRLPVLDIGDIWIAKGTGYTMTSEVIGEDAIDGKDCYIVEVLIEPPIQGARSMLIKLDKATMFPLWRQVAGEYDGLPIKAESSYSYELSGKPYYPLEVGNECKVKHTEITTITRMGETQTQTQTTTYTYAVEMIEDITVSAGTFTCFKIVQCDDSGNELCTYWESDKVKNHEVKSIDHASGEIIELASYSVS